MVLDAWSNLKTQFSNYENGQQLISYFDENYINGKIRMRYRNNRTPKRNEPIFPPEMWLVSFIRGIQKEQKETEVTVERLITNSTSISKNTNDHNIRLQNICKRLEQNPGL